MNEMGKSETSAPLKQSQIEEQLSLLIVALDSTENSARELIDRLSPVLREKEPLCEGVVCDKQDILVPLASELKSFHNRAITTNDILLDILNRLEV